MEPPDNDFMRELITVFSAEADERLSSIDQRLLEFERSSASDVRGDLMKDILRELHTLKGSAGAVNMPDVSRLAHGMENLFGGVEAEGIVPPVVYELAYRGLDRLRALIGDLANGRVPSVDVDVALAELERGPDDDIPVGAAGFDLAGELPDTLAQPEPAAAPAATATIEPPMEIAQAAGPRDPRAGAPDPANPQSKTQAQPQADETVRLSTNKLDSLMARVGELVVTQIGTEQRAHQTRELSKRVNDWEQEWRRARPQFLELTSSLRDGSIEHLDTNAIIAQIRAILPLFEQSDGRLQELCAEFNGLREGIESDERRLGQVTADLEDEVRRTRMLPVATVFDPLHRMVRDLSRDLGKEVGLVVQGGETEVDRSVLEQIRGPLTHLIRNAADHGIEQPHVREMNGKPREGTIKVAAIERGGTLLVSLSDDGHGIDVDRVRAIALEKGIVGPDQLRALPERDALRLVFRPGLTTSGHVTDISGRGVGLDVVREAVERLHGVIDISSEIGIGTTFTLSLPLSVATTQCLLLGVSGNRFALPISAVSRIVSIAPEEIGRAQGREMVTLDDGPVVVTRLEDLLQLTTQADRLSLGRQPAVIVGAEERRFALLIDELYGTQDVVVKPLPKPFLRVRHTAGAALLGTGDIVVILNASDLIRTAVRTGVRMDSSAMGREIAATRAGGRTVMVVDDSIVTRMLEKSILEAAGYTVRVAADGAEAWRMVEAEPVDLIVSDVNMPKMDGLALTARVRSHGPLKNVPVVLVTSLDAPEDHARAVEVGADAYIVKSSFSQEGLLETVGRLI